jgi:hypothetical protein
MVEWSVLYDRRVARGAELFTHKGLVGLSPAMKKAIHGSYSTYRWSLAHLLLPQSPST